MSARCPHCGQPMPSAKPITKRQADALRFVVRYFKASGLGPTLRETAAALKIAQSSAFELLENLARKGYVTRAGGGVSRGTLPTPQGLTSIYVGGGE